MTKQKDLKRRIRERMTKTRESYTTARKQLLAQLAHRPEPRPGLLDGYVHFGGVEGDTAVLHNVFEQSGITNPHTGEPYTEAMLYGLCGGVGFMYFVFEYEGFGPTLTFTARANSLSDPFTVGAFEHTGVETTLSKTGSAKVARKALDAALDAGRAPICTVDTACLPYYGMPQECIGWAPQLIAVAGVDGDRVWIDDRCREPNELSMDALAEARGAYRNAKNRLVTIDAPPDGHDLAAGVRAAIRGTAGGFHAEPYKGFGGNFGFKGMQKWRRLLTDPKDKKGWRKVFDNPAYILRALGRTYECVRYHYTAPDGGRPFYAEFLREAADVTGLHDLRSVADSFDESGKLWREIGEAAVALDDSALAKWRELTDRRLELIRTKGSSAAGELASNYAERESMESGSRIDPSDAYELFDALAERVDGILAIEPDSTARMAEIAS